MRRRLLVYVAVWIAALWIGALYPAAFVPGLHGGEECHDVPIAGQPLGTVGVRVCP